MFARKKWLYGIYAALLPPRKLFLLLNRCGSGQGGCFMKRTLSLNRNNDFRRLYNRGKTFVHPYLVIYYFKNRLEINRLGITVSKKIGNAVVRNRVRRIIKAAYFLCEEKMPLGYDFVIVARKQAANIKSTDIVLVFEKFAAGIENKKYD